jgi:hypothetical protein
MEGPEAEFSLAARFDAFLACLPQLIADERDLGGYCGQDPAVDAWITSAEASRAAALAAARAVLRAPVRGMVDTVLRRAAALFLAVMHSTDPEQVAHFRQAAQDRRWAWRLPATVPGRIAAHRGITAVLDAIETLLALDDLSDGVADPLAPIPRQDTGSAARGPRA